MLRQKEGWSRQTSENDSFRREYSQKQSLLIAPPSGRGARTQDHLELCYIFPFFPIVSSLVVFTLSHVLGTTQPNYLFSSCSINVCLASFWILIDFVNSESNYSFSLPSCSMVVDDERTSKGTHPIPFIRILPLHKRRCLRLLYLVLTGR